jgi:hypothetical protein
VYVGHGWLESERAPLQSQSRPVRRG